MSPISVLICDDHPLFRDGMRALLDSVPETQVVGEAADGETSVAQAVKLKPDVVLMDIRMPGLNGIGATREILRRHPGARILMLTMLEGDDSVFAAMQAGALGYLLKGANQAEILRAIRAVANGEAIFGPGIAQRVMSYFSAIRPSRVHEAFPELTEREREVLALIADGDSNSQIAATLDLSLKTVQNHVSNILNKLQVADRAQAILRAREAGLRGEP